MRHRPRVQWHESADRNTVGFMTPEPPQPRDQPRQQPRQQPHRVKAADRHGRFVSLFDRPVAYNEAHTLDTIDDVVPVRTRKWCTILMIPAAAFMCLVQIAYASTPFIDAEGQLANPWLLLGTLLSLAVPFLLLGRSKYPEPVFWACLVVTLIFPYDPLLMLMALCAFIARRSDKKRTIRAIVAATPVALWAQLRDALNSPEASMWHVVFAKPDSTNHNDMPIMLVEESTIIITAIAIALLGVGVSTLIGLHIRSRTRLNEADARTEAAQHHVAHLQDDLANQQLADAIAAEAHDTLAHSLSLIALNASALQVEATKLSQDAAHNTEHNAETVSRRATTIADKADEIRRQSAGALDEAHAIIDMLRHPQQAWEQLAPTDDTALTRESLDALLEDIRQTGTQLNTWIDIRQLGDLDDKVGKIAYRAIQESLTNACRHAVGMPISLEVTANPQQGVHVHVSNPVPNVDNAQTPMKAGTHDTVPITANMNDTQAAHNVPETQGAAQESEQHTIPLESRQTSRQTGKKHRQNSGSGLPSLAARVHSASGTCRYGVDDRHVFHVDVLLPWHSLTIDSTPL